MNKITNQFKGAAILILTFIGQGAVFAQTNPITKNETQAKQKLKQPVTTSTITPVPEKARTPKSVQKKFTMNLIEGSVIDQDFPEILFIDLITAVEKNTLVVKGDFESTLEFNARKTATHSVKFLGDYSLDDTFAVVRRIAPTGKTIDELRYAFNPDSHQVSVFVLPRIRTLNGIGAPGYQTARQEISDLDILQFETTVESKSAYQASNAYGATVTVEKSIVASSGIAASQVSFLNFKREKSFYLINPPPALQFEMDNSKAAKELPALKALVIFRLVKPYIHYDFVHIKPQRDSPKEISSQDKYLRSEILGIVYYSGLTGEVFARLPEGFGTQEHTLAEQDRASAEVRDRESIFQEKFNNCSEIIGAGLLNCRKSVKAEITCSQLPELDYIKCISDEMDR
ncbi:hypothetical protein ACVBEH_16335 [Roseateles sp. GG27B]